MNFFKKAIFCVAVASGVSLSNMAPAFALPSFESCEDMRMICEETGECTTFKRLCWVYYP